jgi:hypothetical protein
MYLWLLLVGTLPGRTSSSHFYCDAVAVSVERKGPFVLGDVEAVLMGRDVTYN